MNSYSILEFKHFPSILGQSITLDENILFFKAHWTKYNPLERPSFFGEIDNASKYLKAGRKLGVFSTKKKIKLLDIRYVCQIINDLILLRQDNTVIIGYMTLALSFGLVSLYKQLNLYKNRYTSTLKDDKRYEKIIEYYNNYEKSTEKYFWQNPIELQGIRIGETNNDVESTIILKEIFGNFFDGIISPVIFSPYFDENNIPNEILLFEPSNCVNEVENIINLNNKNNITSISIKDIIKNNNINLFSVPYFMKSNEETYFQYGGVSYKKNKIDYIYDKNDLLNTYYENNKKQVKELEKQGKKFKKNMFDKNSKKEDYMFLRNEKLETDIFIRYV
jgi:hypothetical protein